MSGSNISDATINRRYGKDSLGLMKNMIAGSRYHLALDSRHKIDMQYRIKLRADTYGHYFVRQMASMGKTITVPWQDLNKGIRVKLETCGFTRDCEDYKYLVVSSSTSCKKLVSHEPHFFDVQRILRKIGINILLPPNSP